MIGHEDLGVEALAPFTDDELAEMALAADADAPVSSDAIPISEIVGPGMESPLPTWYMPAPIGARRLSGWRGRLVRCSALSVIVSFVVINAFGLCNTYGQLHF
jgi:hypothetical protein